MGAPSTLPADFFDKPQTPQLPDSLPADFFDDPIHAQPATAEDLPSREQFEASHQDAVKSWWDQAMALGETAAPLVFHKAQEIAATPLVPESVMPATATTPAGAVGRSALEFARGMTSPENIGLGALMGPVGKIAPLLSRAVSAGFGVQMLKGAYDQYPEVKDAIDKKDWTRAAGAITTAVLSGGLGVAAGAHAVRGGEVAPVEEQTPIEKATASARAGVEAMAPDSLPADFFDQATSPASPASPQAPAPDALPADFFDRAAGAPVDSNLAAGNIPAREAAPSTPDSLPSDFFDRTAPAAKPLWEMSPNELAAAAADAKGRDQADLHELFGPEGAQQYKRLERAANSTTKSPQETAAASDQLEQMEASLTPEQRNRLYGIGDTRPQLEEIQNYRSALGRVDTSSPEALGDSLKWAVTGVGDKDNPAEMTPDEQIRYAQLRHGMSEAAAQGWDPVEVSQAAFRGAAGRFTPEDAAFMLRRFAQPEGTPQPAPEAEAAQLPAAREPATPPALGREANVLVPGETTTYPARYAVRELADVQPSHNPFSFEANPNYDYTNDRDYSRTQNAARVVKNAAPDTFNPDYPTTDSPTAEHGAPIIDASGNVLGGNSRTMTLARVYQRGGPDAEMYKQAIAAKAVQFGIDPAELERFKNPVLVRELAGGVHAARAITDFNKAAAAELSPDERAVSDGRLLSPQTIQEIAGRLGDLGEEGTLASALRGEDGAAVLNRLVSDGMLTEQEKGGYLDDRDNLTPEAKSRIGKALVGRLFETPAEFRETTPAVRAKLERIAPQLLRVEGRQDWALTDTTRQAIALSEEARVHRMPIEDVAAQSVVGGDRSYSPDAIELARTIAQGPVKAAGAFRRYANDEALSREGSQSQFFTPPTRAEAFRDAFSAQRGGPATTLGSGLGGFEPFFKESREEGNALLAKRRAAMRALDARAGTPEQQKSGEAMRQWFTGERDLWSTRVNQAIDRASRMFTPDVKTREAVGIMREFAHRPGELEKFLDGSHPLLAGKDQETLDRVEALRPAMRDALAPTPKMLKTNRVYTNVAQKSLEEGEAGGWLGSRWKSDEYMPHLLHAGEEGEVPAPPADAIHLTGNIGKHFQFAERRYDEYPTMLHAIADGKIPKTMDPADAFAIHGSNFARARATHLFEQQMGQAGMGQWGLQETAPMGWVPLAQHSDEFSRALQSGGAERLFVPPFIQEALKPLTDPEVSGRAFTAVRGAQRGLKEAILGLSAFHLLTENVMAAADIGPGGMYEAFKQSRDSADFLKWERDGALHGMPTSIQGRTMDAYRNLQPGSIPTRGEIIRAYIPGAKQGLELARHVTEFTFGNLQRRFKVVSYMLHSMAWDEQNPGATEAQRSSARQGIASYVNGVFGGLHWENLGWNKAMVETARLILLAPDWSGSNIALGKYAATDARPSLKELPFRDRLAGATDKPTVQARLSRAFWAKSLTGGLIATQLLSLMFSRQYSRKPFQVYMGKDKDGNEVYSNMAFRGASGDLVNLATKMGEHGLLVGAGEFAGGKAAPFMKAGVHVLTGRNDFGREIAPKGLNPITNTVRGVGQAVSDVSPIPITLKSIQHTTFGDEAGKYTWSERVLGLFGFNTQHVAPEGQRKTAHGLAPVPVRPENSIWQQIVTGKEHPSTRPSR